LRADLLAVATIGGQALVSHTWSAGRMVFSAGYPVPFEPAAPLRGERAAVAA
jgi:alpha-D-ribose 1-methylphosphonate 5-triphosphate diphosphatase